MKKTCNICKKEYDTKQGLSRYWRGHHFNLCSDMCAKKSMEITLAQLNKESTQDKYVRENK